MKSQILMNVWQFNFDFFFPLSSLSLIGDCTASAMFQLTDLKIFHLLTLAFWLTYFFLCLSRPIITERHQELNKLHFSIVNTHGNHMTDELTF